MKENHLASSLPPTLAISASHTLLSAVPEQWGCHVTAKQGHLVTRLLIVEVSGHLALLIPFSHSRVLCSPSPCSMARLPPCSQVTTRGAEWQAPLPQRYVPLCFHLPPVTASAFPVACLRPAGSGHTFTRCQSVSLTNSLRAAMMSSYSSVMLH